MKRSGGLVLNICTFLGPLSPTAHSKSRKWFIVTHGTQVGVFLDMYAFLSHCQYETYLVYQPFRYYLYARLFRC